MIGLFKSLSQAMRGKPIQAGRVYLRPPSRRDVRKWLTLRTASRSFLEPWEPTWPKDALTRKAFFRRLRTYAVHTNSDTAYIFLIFRKDDRALLGSVSINDVRRGVAQSCSIGYWVGENYSGQGYMTEALSALLPFIFHRLKIHRIEAACLPQNKASRALLKKIGFQEEGYVRRYLKINGQWQDHVLFSLLETDSRMAPVPLARESIRDSRVSPRRERFTTAPSPAQSTKH
jgi:ribosomal-protein-alanine N-acetyltransferase